VVRLLKQPSPQRIPITSSDARRACGLRAQELIKRRCAFPAIQSIPLWRAADCSVVSMLKRFLSYSALQELSRLAPNEYWFFKVASMALYIREQSKRSAKVSGREIRTAAREIRSLCKSAPGFDELLLTLETRGVRGLSPGQVRAAQRHGFILVGPYIIANPIFSP